MREAESVRQTYPLLHEVYSDKVEKDFDISVHVFFTVSQTYKMKIAEAAISLAAY